MSLILDEHRQYLADRARLRHYATALREVVRPSDVVLDLASGTSVLGVLACRAGAARVYSVEADGIATVARAIAAANCGDRLTVIRAHSSEAELPEPADLVVSDQIGRFGFDAGLLPMLRDARARLLRPGARTVPSTLALVIAPVAHPRQFAHVAFWQRPRAGLDLTPVAPLAANTIYPTRLAADALLAEPHAGGAIDLARDAPASLDLDAVFVVARDGRLDGIAGWFRAQLSPSVMMSNGPDDPHRILRRQAFMPIERPIDVRQGDRIEVSVRALWNAMVVAWRVSVHSRGMAFVEFRHSTLEGMLIDPAALGAGDPASRPSLTARGAARRTVLELCDGSRSLREIEAEVFAQHRALFASADEAAVFVGEVVTRYARDAR